MNLEADKDYLAYLAKAFKKIDVDGSGKLSKTELEDAEKNGFLNIKGKWRDVLKTADINGDGELDIGEFQTAAVLA